MSTGADDIYVLPAITPEIEEACQLPLVMAQDITPAQINWSGHHLVNPFDDQSETGLKEFITYPRFAAYFERHRERLKKRHVAKMRPHAWYRTIDRVTHRLTTQPKLLLPDIQAGGVIGYDVGQYYPHHNVYWITSSGWNLRALQALLRSSFVLEQIRAHSVQMRGGSLRYQAQVLRKIRLPHFDSVSKELIAQLVALASAGDQAELDAVCGKAFQL